MEQSPGGSAGGLWCSAGKPHEMFGTGRNPAYMGLPRWKVETAKWYHEKRQLPFAMISSRAILMPQVFNLVGDYFCLCQKAELLVFVIPRNMALACPYGHAWCLFLPA